MLTKEIQLFFFTDLITLIQFHVINCLILLRCSAFLLLLFRLALYLILYVYNVYIYNNYISFFLLLIAIFSSFFFFYFFYDNKIVCDSIAHFWFTSFSIQFTHTQIENVKWNKNGKKIELLLIMIDNDWAILFVWCSCFGWFANEYCCLVRCCFVGIFVLSLFFFLKIAITITQSMQSNKCDKTKNTENQMNETTWKKNEWN